MKSQKGVVHLILLLLLVAGIGIGLYLVQHPAIFKPKASENEPVSTGPKPELVFVFTSESNSGGLACNCFATEEELKETDAVQILNNKTYAFENLRIGFNSLIDHDKFNEPPLVTDGTTRGTAHGFELQLAKSVKEHAFPNDKVYLVKTGQGGSRLREWGPDGLYWQKFLNRVNSAKVLLGSKPIQWVVWYSLGVNDHNDKTPVSDFKTGTLAHINKIKTALPGAIVIMTQFQELGDKDFGEYNTAMAEIANTEPNVYVVDTTIPPHAPYPNGAKDLTNDNFHWEHYSLEVIVKRMVNITKAALKMDPPMTANPNPCNLTTTATSQTCTSTIKWDFPDITNLKITIKENQGSVFATGSTGSIDAPWINAQSSTFQAYSGVNLLSEIAVKGVLPSPGPSGGNQGGVEGPILISDPNSNKITATPCTIPSGQTRCTSTVTWSTANITGPVKIIIKETGGLFAQGPSGSQQFPWVSKIPLTMQLIDGNNPVPLASIVVQASSGVFIGTGKISATPCTVLPGQSRCTSKVTWETNDANPPVKIIIKETGGLLSQSPSGSVDFPWVSKIPLTLQIIEANNNTPLGTIILESTPILSASPCYLEGGKNTCTSVISWRSNIPDLKITLKEVPGSVFASGSANGSQSAPWITASGITFQAWSKNQLLESLFVKALSSTVRTQ